MEYKDRTNPRGVAVNRFALGGGGGGGGVGFGTGSKVISSTAPKPSNFTNRQLDKFYAKRTKQKQRDAVLNDPKVAAARKRVTDEVMKSRGF